MAEYEESGGRGFADLLILGAIGTGAAGTYARFKAAGGKETVERAGEIAVKSEQGARILEDLLAQVGENTVDRVEIEKTLTDLFGLYKQELEATLGGPAEGIKKVKDALRTSLHYAGGPYRKNLSTMMNIITPGETDRYTAESMFGRIEGVLTERASLKETRKALSLFQQHIKAMKHPGAMASLTGELIPGAVHTQGAEGFLSSLGQRFLRGAPGTALQSYTEGALPTAGGAFNISFRKNAVETALSVPRAFGAKEGFVSMGRAGQTRYAPGRFLLENAAGVASNQPLNYTEFYLWNMQNRLLPDIAGMKDTFAIKNRIKEFKSEMAGYLGESVIEGTPSSYENLREGYVHRLRLESNRALSPISKPTTLGAMTTGEQLFYSGVSPQAMSKGTVSSTPLSDLVPFGWEESAIGARPDSLVRDWAPSQRAINIAKSMETPGGVLRVGGPLSTIEDPLIPTMFYDQSKLTRIRKRVADGAGLASGSATSRALAEKTSVKAMYLRASAIEGVGEAGNLAEQIVAGLKGTNEVVFDAGDFAIDQKLGLQIDTGEPLFLKGDQQILSAARTVIERPGGGLEPVTKLDYLWTPAVESHPKFWTAKEVFSFTEDVAPQDPIRFVEQKPIFQGEAIDLTPQDPIRSTMYGENVVRSRIPGQTAHQVFQGEARMGAHEVGLSSKIVDLADPLRITDISQIKKYEWFQKQQMFESLQELTAILMKKGGANAIALGRHQQEAYGLYQHFKDTGASSEEVARTLLQRGSAAGLPTETVGGVYGGLKYHLFKDMSTEQVAGRLGEWGIPKEWAPEIMETHGVFGFMREAYKGPASYTGAGGMASFEHRGFLIGGHDPGARAVLEEIAERRVLEGSEHLSRMSEFGETLATLAGETGSKSGEQVALRDIPTRSMEDFNRWLQERGGGVYANFDEMTLPFKGAERNVSQLYIPDAANVGSALEEHALSSGRPVTGWATKGYYDTLVALKDARAGDLTAEEAAARIEGVVGRDIGPAYASSIIGKGRGSNVKGLFAGKVPGGKKLRVISDAIPMPKGFSPLGYGETALATDDALDMIKQLERDSRTQEQAEAIREALFDPAGNVRKQGKWTGGVWRHPLKDPHSISTSTLRINPDLWTGNAQVGEHLREFAVPGEDKWSRTATSWLKAAHGDYDADTIDAILLSPARQGNKTSAKALREAAIELAVLNRGIRAGAEGIIPTLAERDRLAAMKAYTQYSQTGSLSNQLLDLKLGLKLEHKAGRLSDAEFAKDLGLLGHMEELPISSKHYALSEAEAAAIGAGNLSQSIEARNYKASASLMGEMAGTTKDPINRRLMMTGETIPIRTRGLQGGAEEIVNLTGYDVENRLKRIYEIANQQVTPEGAAMNRRRVHRLQRGAAGSLLEYTQMRQGAVPLDTIAGFSEALATHPSPQGTMSQVVGKMGALKRQIAAGGGKLLEHSVPLAFGFGAALAIGSFFSAPRPSVPSGASSPINVKIPKGSGPSAPMATPYTGPGIHGAPSMNGVLGAPKAYLQKAGRFIGETWNAAVTIRPRGDVDAQGLANQISHVTRNQANVNINIANWRKKMTRQQAEDMVFGE